MTNLYPQKDMHRGNVIWGDGRTQSENEERYWKDANMQQLFSANHQSQDESNEHIVLQDRQNQQAVIVKASLWTREERSPMDHSWLVSSSFSVQIAVRQKEIKFHLYITP